MTSGGSPGGRGDRRVRDEANFGVPHPSEQKKKTTRTGGSQREGGDWRVSKCSPETDVD